MLRQLVKVCYNTAVHDSLASYRYFRHGQHLHNVPRANWPEAIKTFLSTEKIQKPTLIQERTLPIAMESKDSVGIARTGSGKTLAFVVPGVMKILKERESSNFTMARRQFHAPDSKVHYLDFRHRFNNNHIGMHLLIIRRQKMKKHRRRKFRRNFKCLLAKQRLKREVAKEKAFRVELLTMIRRAEMFDPREYAMNKIAEINSVPKEPSREEKLETLKELIRVNRYQVDYIKPKHRRADV